MRLFVALTPSASAIQHLDAAMHDVRSQAEALRWVRPESWHLTLAFLGEVAAADLEPLAERLARAASHHRPMSLRFGSAGRFGDRVLYTQVDGDRVELTQLAGSVSAAARRTGLDVDERPYRPHLTLARSAGGVDLRPLVATLSPYVGLDWPAASMQLMESRRPEAAGEPPTYVVVDQWPLGEPPVAPTEAAEPVLG